MSRMTHTSFDDNSDHGYRYGVKTRDEVASQQQPPDGDESGGY